MTPPLTDPELFRRLLLAAALGGIIGAERELHHKSAGFRTNILIAMGAAVFTLMSLAMSPPGTDQGRISAQIVSGIGFLGAGTIMRTRGSVHGLTTAATVWVNAALGVAAGAGEFHLAMIGGLVTLAVLLVLGPLERGIERRVWGSTPEGRPPTDRSA